MNKSFRSICVVLFLIITIRVSAQHTYECPVCHGEKIIPTVCPNRECHNGLIFCEACDYSGTITHVCQTCQGTGVVTKVRDIPCPNCKGKKGFIKEKQIPCPHCRNGKRPTAQHGQTVYVDCKYCGGKGYTISKYTAACRICGGSGKQGQETYTVKCADCEGKGIISELCKQCGGKGSYQCPTCKGYGNISTPCDRCHGDGVIHTAN